MNKTKLIKQTCELLRENQIKKPVSIPKQTFHISDDEGNSKDFTVKKIDKTVIYTVDDVTAIVEACISVMKESLKRGEPINIRGFGSLGLHYRKPRSTKRIGTGEEIQISGRYVPKFNYGDELRLCAKVYEMSLEDHLDDPEPIYGDDDIELDGTEDNAEDGE